MEPLGFIKNMLVLSSRMKVGESKQNFNSLRNDMVLLINYGYLLIIFMLFLIAIIEIKRAYNIDVLPGVDTPFDNLYYASIE